MQELLKSGKIKAADVQSGNCIHPACLKSSLTQSLTAMHLRTVRKLHVVHHGIQLVMRYARAL